MVLVVEPYRNRRGVHLHEIKSSYGSGYRGNNQGKEARTVAIGCHHLMLDIFLKKGSKKFQDILSRWTCNQMQVSNS